MPGVAAPDDRKLALRYIENYALKMGGTPFAASDVRSSFERSHPTVSIDGRAWGSLMLKASIDRVIARAGMENRKTDTSHRKPVNLWTANYAAAS